MLGFVAGDKDLPFLVVEAVVEAGGVEEALRGGVSVAEALQGVAEALPGVVAVVVASGAEGDFRIALCNFSNALLNFRCHLRIGLTKITIRTASVFDMWVNGLFSFLYTAIFLFFGQLTASLFFGT